MKRSRLKRVGRKAAAKGRNKYGAKSCVYDGRTFHSRKEAAYAETLDLLKNAADPRERVVSWRGQVNVDLYVAGTKICRIIPDFEVVYADGHSEIHEVKGLETPEWKIKSKLFMALHPGLTYKVIR